MKKLNFKNPGIWYVIIFLIIAILNSLFDFFFSRLYLINNILINFVPAIIFYVFYKLRKRIKYKYLILGINVTLVIISIILLLTNFMFGCFTELFTPIDDINYYHRVLRVRNNYNYDLMYHFPKSIPKNSKDIKFGDANAFRGGGYECDLSYTSEDKIDLTEYQQNSKYVINNRDDLNKCKENLHLPYYILENLGLNNLNNYDETFKEKNYTIYVLKLKDSQHGYSSGLAVNENTNRVFYWSYEW